MIPVGTRSTCVDRGKMAVKLGTMRASEIQYTIYSGSQQWAIVAGHHVEMGEKELDPLVKKRNYDERDRWIARSCCVEIFRRKWELNYCLKKICKALSCD